MLLHLYQCFRWKWSLFALLCAFNKNMYINTYSRFGKHCLLDYFKYSSRSYFKTFWFESYLFARKMFVWSFFFFFAILNFLVKMILSKPSCAIYRVDFIMNNLSNTLYLLWELHHLEATFFSFILNINLTI